MNQYVNTHRHTKRESTIFGVTPDCKHHQTEDGQLAYPQMNQVLRCVLQEKKTDS